MKVLLLSYHPPFHPTLDHVVPTHLRCLAPHVEFVLLCMVRSPVEAHALTGSLAPYCRRIETVLSPRPPASVGVRPKTPAYWLRGLRSVLSTSAATHPWTRIASAPTHFYYSRSYSERLRAVVTEEQPDVVHFQDMITSTHWDDVPDWIPRIFCPVDCISRWFHEGYRVASCVIDRWTRYGRFLETRAWERFVIPKFNMTALVSPVDARWLVESVPGGRVTVVPMCVDTEYYRPLPLPEDDPSVLFTGMFTYPSNREAIGYFVRDILPGIRSSVPALKFYVVGENPDASIRGLASDRRNVVTASVEDIRTSMATAAVSVAPMRSGTGVKLKVLRPMAMARAVVSTREGIEGLSGVEDQTHLLVADTPAQFVAHVVRLLRDATLRREVGDRARRFVLERHGMDCWAARFLQIYRDAM